MSKYLNTAATALILSALAGGATAQETPACSLDDPQFPCTVDDTVIESLEDLQAAGTALAEEAPAEEAPAEEAATEEAPVEEAPAEEAVTEAAPAEEAPAEEAATEEAPAEEVPAEEAATEEASAEEAPAEEAVTEEAPAEEAPAEEAVTEEAPAEEAPAEEASTEEAPAEEAPAEEAATEEGNEEESAPQTTEVEALPDETPPAPEDTVDDTAAPAAIADDATGEAIEEQTITENDVRSSDEDFAAQPTAEARSNDDDDDGLSDFEKALLLGVGAIVAGSILDSGEEVVSNSGDRVVLQNPDGSYRVLKDDDVLLRQPGSNVRSERFADGSTRTFVTQADGTEVVTIRTAQGRVLRRALVLEDGSQVELFNDTQPEKAVDVSALPVQQTSAPDVSMAATEEELRTALQARLATDLDRTFSLRQVRDIRQVRELAPLVELDTITFQTGSAAIQPDQARQLAQLGTAIKDIVSDNPGEVFLIEGHTDAVGSASSNLALSDRRAETVALALTEYFDIPAANLVTQGYGESALRVRTLDAEQANRRASLRNITQLLR